jgi:hypothetical protein
MIFIIIKIFTKYFYKILKIIKLNLINRILELVAMENPEADFTRKTGISSSNIANWRKNPDKDLRSDILIQILKGYPEVSAEWLLRGIGLQFSKNIYNIEKIVTTAKEDEATYNKKENLMCVLTGGDCSFREMDALRKENEQLKKELNKK